jgi:excisionase family DNA binding protein
MNAVQGSVLLTVDEVAALLRTTPKAVYALAERQQIAGVTRIGRRLLFSRESLLDWLRQKSTPSLKE